MERVVIWIFLSCACHLVVARNVTVSGQSAGGSMAIQHLVAFSSSVQGAGIAAGSPYGCGALVDGDAEHTLKKKECYYGGINVIRAINYVRQHFEKGLIDDPANLRSTPIVVFNGKNDWEVYTKCSRDIVKQLAAFVQPGKVESKFDTKASHVWSIDHGSCRCGNDGYGVCGDVSNCNYDLSGDMLKRFYGTLKPRAKVTQKLSWIPQKKYLPPKSPDWNNAHVEEWAVAYVPSGCAANPDNCRVHVNYHGCIVNLWPARKKWVTNLDLNEYGEANDIIVLYPQAHGDSTVGGGCWNWGFPEDDKMFDTRQSVQLRMVMNIVTNLTEAIHGAVQLPKEMGPPQAEQGHLSVSTIV